MNFTLIFCFVLFFFVFSITIRELDRVTADEELHRQQIMDLERGAVMNKHEIKEVSVNSIERLL